MASNKAEKMPFLCKKIMPSSTTTDLSPKKKNKGIAKRYTGLFLLFSLLICLFWSLSQDYNLKATVEGDLYLKFAKG